jgi:hypothetical protein
MGSIDGRTTGMVSSGLAHSWPDIAIVCPASSDVQLLPFTWLKPECSKVQSLCWTLAIAMLEAATRIQPSSHLEPITSQHISLLIPVSAL